MISHTCVCVCVCVRAGNPVVLRYWKEANVTADWLKPDQSSAQTVEMTVYVLLTLLLKVMLLPVYFLFASCSVLCFILSWSRRPHQEHKTLCSPPVSLCLVCYMKTLAAHSWTCKNILSGRRNSFI